MADFICKRDELRAILPTVAREKNTAAHQRAAGMCRSCGRPSVYLYYEMCGGYVPSLDVCAECENCADRSHWKTYGSGAAPVSTEDEAAARAFAEVTA